MDQDITADKAQRPAPQGLFIDPATVKDIYMAHDRREWSAQFVSDRAGQALIHFLAV